MSIIPVENAIFQYLSANGDGTGATSQNVDGSSAAVEFSIEPPAGESYILKRMNVEAIDGNFNNANLYGTITLANGMSIHIENGAGDVLVDFTPINIKRTHDWALLAGVDSFVIGGATSDALKVRWTFMRGWDDMHLNGDNGEKLVLTVNDLMTGLDDQLVMVQGYKRDNKTESNL